jgi:hypothetical protein
MVLRQRNFKRQISEPVDLYLKKGQQDMWDGVLSVFRKMLDKAEGAYMSKAKSVSSPFKFSLPQPTKSVFFQHRFQLHRGRNCSLSRTPPQTCLDLSARQD